MVSDVGVRLDLWRVCLSAGEWYVPYFVETENSVRYSATEYLVCYMLHQVELSATHKFALTCAGRSILVRCKVIIC